MGCKSPGGGMLRPYGANKTIEDGDIERYSTVIHLEQSVYLAIWKDLNKEKRKEQRNKI